jgi:hypothetical protein
MQLYIYKNNQQLGPYQEAAVIGWFQTGQCSPGDLAIREGMTEWKPLGLISSAASVESSRKRVRAV